MRGESAVSRLATRMGVLRGYWDFRKVRRRTSATTDRALLAALGTPVASQKDAEAQLQALDAEDAARLAPREIILRAGAAARIALRHPAEWTLHLEGGGNAAASGGGDAAAIPPLPSGVHRLELDGPSGPETVWLIAAPRAAPSLKDCAGGEKAWGLIGALYGLNSARNSGLGDYRDLGGFAAAAGSQGAAFFGINPVHAPGAAAPEGMISPYSPTHRGFLSPWHIALDNLAPYGGDAPPAGGGAAGELIDYAAAAARREPALAAAFANFAALDLDHPARRRLDAFRRERGADLEAFATFEALSLRHGGDWRDWPPALQDRNGPAVVEFARARPEETLVHAWLQWVADGQLAAAQARAKAGGMRLGLYLDLAVGARPGGAETWMDPAGHATGATMGAPPDAFGDTPQKWSLAPLSPHGLRDAGYRPFIELLRGVMRHAGVIRIDHVLGLMRGFWVPDDGAPGGYVRFPFEPLLAVIRIEAARQGVVVVGEDLGLVPRGFQNRLSKSGLYGVDVAQFMRSAKGGLPEPAELRRKSMASFGNHDTPTIEGFFAARDLDWSHRLGRISAERRETAGAERAELAARLAESEGPSGKMAGPKGESARRRDRIHRDLANSTAEMVAVQIDDLTGAVEQQNLPGTIDEHPNWRRRSSLSVEEAGASPELARVAAVMRAAGRGGGDATGK